jgi:hypothetical protein
VVSSAAVETTPEPIFFSKRVNCAVIHVIPYVIFNGIILLRLVIQTLRICTVGFIAMLLCGAS